jgi:hypothetical protein
MNPGNRKKSVKVSTVKSSAKPNSNLVTARVSLFYGLEYKKSLTNKVSTVSGLVATPNIIFNSGETGAFFDFSDWKNTSSTENEFIKFWKNVPIGASFTVSNAELYNEKNNKKYDLSGTYTLTEIENLIIISSVVSITNKDQNISLYSKKQFNQTPIFEFTSTPVSSDSTSTFIINTFGQNTKTSFTYMGASVGDYILLQGEESSYEIEEITIDSEGKEIIKIKGELPEENRVGIKTLVQLKIKVAPNVASSDINVNDTTIGSCTVGDICYNNQTKSQCLLRVSGNLKTKFTENNECVDASNRNIIPSEVVPATPSSDEIVVRLLNDISKTISINPKSGKIF